MPLNLFQHQIQQSSESISSGEKQIRVDSFVPVAQGRYPAVIVLHGSGGIRESFSNDPACMLAASGFAVFLLHYFERTGTSWADDRSIRHHFPVWMGTITDAITQITKLPKVDSSRIALLGFSLGAYLALSVAAHDPRVRAVIDFFGGLPEEFEHALPALPPVLILHGEQDRIVPVSEAYRLRDAMTRLNLPFELRIYPGAGHGFSGLPLFDSAQRTLSFLRQHLAAPEQEKAS